MLTQRATLLGFVGFCFYLIAIVNALPPYYYALTWLVVGMLVSSAGLALLSLNAVQCDWSVVNPRGSQGQNGPVVEFAFSNSGSLNKTGILIEFRLRARRGGEVLLRRALVEALPSGMAIETTIPIPNLPRGRYELLEVRLIGSDVLGLFRRQKRVASRGEAPLPELICGPALLTLNPNGAFFQPASGQLAGRIEARDRIGQGEELRGTRPYVPGDDLRHVHWKSTARTGQFVVKETHQASRNWPVVIWDGAAHTEWGVEGETTTEWGLRLAASLARTLAQNGHGCGLARLDEEPILISSRGEVEWSMMVDALADARAQREISLEAALSTALPSSTRLSEIYLVSASLSPELLRLVSQWNERDWQVRVALFNSAAFWGIASGGRGKSPWQELGKERFSITRDAFESQLKAMQKAGAHAVLIEPSREDWRDFEMPLRRAAAALLERV